MPEKTWNWPPPSRVLTWCRLLPPRTIAFPSPLTVGKNTSKLGLTPSACPYWCIHPDLYNRLTEGDQGEARRRIDWEAAKTRVLSILMERARQDEQGLSNKEIRQITRFDRNQVLQLMAELRRENPEIQPPGRGKYARHAFKE